MSHDHSHVPGGSPHAGDATDNRSRLFAAFALTLVTLLVEAVGGWWSGSLALLADAAHMLVDAAALLFAFLGAWIARRDADSRRSFGYARMKVLAGYTNALAQFVLAAWIVVEAAQRLFAPGEILAGMMFWVALAGLVVNLVVLRALHVHDDHDVNTAGARLHVLGDLLGSIGAIAAAASIHWFGWRWADPAISVLISLLILGSAWRLLRRCAHILLEGTPEGVDGRAVAAAIEGAGIGVGEVHHVHVWELAGGSIMATLHARLSVAMADDNAIVAVQQVLRERFGITHATIQLEAGHCDGGHGECASHH